MSRTSPQRSNSVASNRQGRSSHVLGPSLSVRGRVEGEGDLAVGGKIEGDVRITGDLKLEEEGRIVGNAYGQNVILSGELNGDVHAQGEVTLRAGCRVTGNMNGTQIALEEGAGFRGRIEADFTLPDGMEDGPSAARAPSGRRR